MRSLAILVLLLSTSASTFADEAETRKQARAHYQAGTIFFDAGAFDQAIAEYERGYRLEPIPEFLFNLGQASRLKGDLDAAARFYQRYLDDKPKGAVADEARRHLQEIAAAHPTAAPAPPEPAPPPAPTATTAPSPQPIAQPPIASHLAATPPERSRSSPTPVYKRWWLWSAVAAAAAAVAIGVGVGVTAHGDNGTTFSTIAVP
jgi:iron complex outermembrane receptor protein